MTVLFIRFPKDTAMYVQRSGVPTGATKGNNNTFKNGLST